MTYSGTAWATLEQWSPTAFLAAAGLFVFPVLAFGFGVVTGAEIDVSPAIMFLFVLIIFVGLLGLYPRLAGRNSTLAQGGVGLLAATAAIILSTLASSVLPIGFSFGKTVIAAIVMTVLVGSTLTLTAFGIASLRSGVYSRPVGGFLLTTSAGMSLVIVGMLLFGDPTHMWVPFIANGLIAISLGAIGYTLRIEDISTEHAEPTTDVTAN